MVVKDELGYLGREVLVAYFKVLSLHLAGGGRESLASDRVTNP